MNKQQIETIIDKLAGRCHCYDSCSPKFKHPILIGDVLEKLTNTKPLFDMILAEEILDIWRRLGLDKSLQEIVKESGWENEFSTHTPEVEHREVLKSPEATKLFKFLHQVIKKL